MASTTEPLTKAAGGRTPQVVVISHSPLFYWWPVWVVGFLMAGLSYWQGDQVAFVPTGTVAERGAGSRDTTAPGTFSLPRRGSRYPPRTTPRS